MSRPLGGYIGHRPVPAAAGLNSAAGGVWTLREAQRLKQGGTWPVVFIIPLQISGLQCWLDANDAGTLYNASTGGSLVAANGGVARWEDKSSNSNHATDVVDGSGATISTQRPTRVATAQNGLDAINFDGAQWFDHNSARAMLRNRSCAIMAVAMKYGTVGNSINQFAWANRNAATGDVAMRYQISHRSDNSIGAFSRRLDTDVSGALLTIATTPPYDTSWHVHVSLCDWTNGTHYYRIDGTQVSTGSYVSIGNTSDTSLGTVASSDNGGTWTAIGASNRTIRSDDVANNLPLSSGSQIGEMICFARTSGSYLTADLQAVEAYLAWRWGLQGNLPAGHPYKSVQPSF